MAVVCLLYISVGRYLNLEGRVRYQLRYRHTVQYHGSTELPYHPTLLYILTSATSVKSRRKSSSSGTRCVQELLERLNCFPIAPCPIPIHLTDPQDEEEEEEEPSESMMEDMETEDLMRTMASRKAPSSKYRWRRSRWLRTCPVELADGNVVPGKTEFTVA